MFWLLLLFLCLGLLNWQICLLALFLVFCITYPPLGIGVFIAIVLILIFQEEKKHGD